MCYYNAEYKSDAWQIRPWDDDSCALHLFGVTKFWFSSDGKYFESGNWQKDLGLQ